MKTIMFAGAKMATLIAVACLACAYPMRSSAQSVPEPLAVIVGVQGRSAVAMQSGHKLQKLGYGSIVNTGETVSTSGRTKVLLKWETGMLTALGGHTSVNLRTENGRRGAVDVLDVTKGVVRVTKRSGGGNDAPYKVNVPEGSIEPVDHDAPVDFTVQAFLPTRSVLTVIAGPVKVSKQSKEGRTTATIVSDCRSVRLDRRSLEPRVVSLNSIDAGKLLNRITIPGTAGMNFACPVPTWLF